MKTAGLTKALALLSFAVFAPDVVYAQAYKCAARDGRVSFQEVPCATSDTQSDLKLRKTQSLSDEEKRALRAQGEGKVVRGMTAEQLRASWGAPDKINKSVGSYGTHEQWIYTNGSISRSQYIYLENGKVTSFQSPSQ